jgi:ferredoxin-type protein NapF
MGFFSAINLFFRKKPNINFLRPPGTTDENVFLSLCIRCRACANVCEAGCIKFFSLLETTESAGTPYVNSRLRACNLCMNCTNVCPTGALDPIVRELEAIKENVAMGKAAVIESNCLSFNGRTCGVCYDACPVKAILLFERAKPRVIDELCIGCGRCEERCPQVPTAIIVRRAALNPALV